MEFEHGLYSTSHKTAFGIQCALGAGKTYCIVDLNVEYIVLPPPSGARFLVR